MSTTITDHDVEIELRRSGRCPAGHYVDLYVRFDPPDAAGELLLYTGVCERCDRDDGGLDVSETVIRPVELRDLEWIPVGEDLPTWTGPVGARRLLDTLHKAIPLRQDVICWLALELVALPWSSTERARVELAHSLASGALSTACGSFDEGNWRALTVAIALQRDCG